MELEKEAENIKCDVKDISEVRRQGEEILELESGNILYYQEQQTVEQVA